MYERASYFGSNSESSGKSQVSEKQWCLDASIRYKKDHGTGKCISLEEPHEPPSLLEELSARRLKIAELVEVGWIDWQMAHIRSVIQVLRIDDDRRAQVIGREEVVSWTPYRYKQVKRLVHKVTRPTLAEENKSLSIISK